MRAYQRSRLRIPAKSRSPSRYARVTIRLIDCRCLASKPRSRPATAKLATSRFTSHSNGPGSVSSKSLMLNISRRSGPANAPKFDRCASPQSCTSSPLRGCAGQIRRHRVGRAAEERERRHEHPPVADRHQLLHPGRRLLLQQLDRIGPISRRLPFAVRARGAIARAALPVAARSSGSGAGLAFGLACRLAGFRTGASIVAMMSLLLGWRGLGAWHRASSRRGIAQLG